MIQKQLAVFFSFNKTTLRVLNKLPKLCDAITSRLTRDQETSLTFPRNERERKKTDKMASTTLTHASGGHGYTEFYLSNLWSWTPAGVRRVFDYLDNLNLVCCSPSSWSFGLSFRGLITIV